MKKKHLTTKKRNERDRGETERPREKKKNI